MKKLFYILMFLPAAIGLTGCSCQQQLSRLQHRCPECFDSVRENVHAELPIPERISGFTFPMSELLADGTVSFTSPDNITLVINLTDSTADSLSAKVYIPADTVSIEVPVSLPCPDCPQCNSNKDDLKTIIALIAVTLFFAWMIIYNIRRFKHQ